MSLKDIAIQAQKKFGKPSRKAEADTSRYLLSEEEEQLMADESKTKVDY